jgi:3-oxoacyl-[acyl-carrier-protein] synthase II
MLSVLTAVREVSSGRADLALAGACESSLTRFLHAGFQRMGALVSGDGDPSGAVRPFDAGRMGFLLAEGAAVLVLESPDRVARRGASVRALITGCAATCDAYDQVAPEPSGAAERAAAELALQRSGRSPEDVGGIWLHGTATRSGDPAELKALDPLGRAAGRGLPATASKGATGHMLGASGAVELALAVGCLERGVLPAVTNLRQPIGEGAVALVRGDPAAFREPSCLVLSAGFGGHCGAVIVEVNH